MTVVDNLAAVRTRIDEACRRAGRASQDVRLIAVSKRQPDERLRLAYDAGHRDFGENFVQELVRKKALLPGDVRWHLIGHVQSNKAADAACASMVHTVDSEKIVRRLGAARKTPLEVLLQINVGDETTKSGLSAAEAEVVLKVAIAEKTIVPRGLMCIPKPGSGRTAFAALGALRDDLELRCGVRLPELSMGMSEDFEDAILEGATLVRVGTAIFGSRH